jgi:outer membrane protein OmpA-like peptidoglycan-associated protein
MDQNIASTESGVFGQCVKHSFLAGKQLEQASFLKGKIDASVIPAQKMYYETADDASKVALEERRLAEQACRKYYATEFASASSKTSNVALNTAPRNSVFFDLGSATLSPAEKAKLSSIIETYKQSPGTEVVITGRTDTTGDETFNQALSTKRAVAVFEELKSKARAENITLPPSRIEVVGAGEVNGPPNNESRADRRVEVIVVQPGRASLAR